MYSVELTKEELHQAYRAVLGTVKKNTKDIESYLGRSSPEKHDSAINSLKVKKALCDKLFNLLFPEVKK